MPDETRAAFARFCMENCVKNAPTAPKHEHEHERCANRCVVMMEKLWKASETHMSRKA